MASDESGKGWLFNEIRAAAAAHQAAEEARKKVVTASLGAAALSGVTQLDPTSMAAGVSIGFRDDHPLVLTTSPDDVLRVADAVTGEVVGDTSQLAARIRQERETE